MAKQPINEFLEAATEPGTFRPSDPQRKYKAAILSKISNEGFWDLKTMKADDFSSLLHHREFSSWSVTPGFMAWLTNANESQEKLEYLFMLALDSLEEMISNTAEKAQGARVKALQLAIELAGKMPGKKLTASIPGLAQIDNMDKAQLDAWFEKQGLTATISLSKNQTPQTPTVKTLEAHVVEDEDGKI